MCLCSAGVGLKGIFDCFHGQEFLAFSWTLDNNFNGEEKRIGTGRPGRKPGHGRTAALGGIDFWLAANLDYLKSNKFLDFAPRGLGKQLDS